MNRVVDINLSAAELMQISQQLGLGLSREEMLYIREHFRKLDRLPTELELQALGQEWSEHCSYKSSLPLLRRWIFDIPTTTEVLLSEDAGVVGLDEEHVYVVALESHNHPSAIEPYGGAATGIGGVIRDVLCMGALPIALIDGLFFASPETPIASIPSGVKAPRYLLNRVVEGISDYGNRVGIPTCSGMIAFHPSYLSNCLVNVGCIGVARRDEIVRSRVSRTNEILVLVGGKTGRDGIHGVTFASANLSQESERKDRSAVQLGDPITEEPLIHACLEANKQRLIAGMKDLGGGGLSCAVTEIVGAAELGARIDLAAVNCREEMEPWEIWISESQERMLLSVAPQNLDMIATIFRRWQVQCHPIGEVIAERVIIVTYHEKELARMDGQFLLTPPQLLVHRDENREREDRSILSSRKDELKEAKCIPAHYKSFPEPSDYNEILLQLLAAENIASRAFVIRQYDYEVGARTITKPLQGRQITSSPADAVIIKPLRDSYIGLALTCDVTPQFTARDPFWGAAAAVDEVCRNLAAAGAVPHSLADCLCMGDPTVQKRMEEMKGSCRGLNFVARALGLPFASGNVSLYNETDIGSIVPTPTVLGVGIIKDIRTSLTADLKGEGNLLFLIGRTEDELYGSEYLALLGREEGNLPRVDPVQLQANCTAMARGASEKVIIAAHDLSTGGIGVCLAELTFGGGIGCQVDLQSLTGLRPDSKLFSESNSRFIVEVPPHQETNFRTIFRDCPVYFLGMTGGERIQIDDNGRSLIDVTIDSARTVWEQGLSKYFQEERWISAS
ncbi:phosphoribosylformylglycinamidine synthase subunit PurL [Candidatus Acetothermia bacterium]|jgi:phosphoribosylformylglycinamidine synthase|nr:phosphoribosylformylglycinamidine synthase subunit PurL [Candidatus Acetothermia bacterium]MCI2427830.1 phosphoribosylformylglycinamidine synthase subunit PurL [Candidatus Acetothermia bacterium]MCI2428414.1 phosphoribosylformylglycinamidine synthase subunit PurL [Candidatus Acetothermia bacterium]